MTAFKSENGPSQMIELTWRNQTIEIRPTSIVYGAILTPNYDFFFWRTLVVGLECLINYKFPFQHQINRDPNTVAAVKLGVRKESIDSWNSSPMLMHS
jgi:hypothetical protein